MNVGAHTRRGLARGVLAVAVLAFGCAQGWTQQPRPMAATPVLAQGTPLLRLLNGNQTQRFTLELQAEQLARLVVDQRGIDVVVRVESPQGMAIAEYDSPNGTRGPERLSVVSPEGGTYVIVVQPLVQNRDTAPGQFEARLEEVRHATARELKGARAPEQLKSRGIAAVDDAVALLEKGKSPLNRIHVLLQAAQLLAGIDEPRTRRLVAEATQAIRRYTSREPANDTEFNSYFELMNQRRSAMQWLATLDPDLAVEFIHSTRLPDAWNANGGTDQEPDIEANLASAVAAKAPLLAARLAEGALAAGYSYGLANAISALRNSSPALAARVAGAAATRLLADQQLDTSEAASLMVALLRLAHAPMPVNASQPRAEQLLEEGQYRALFARGLAVALATSPDVTPAYSPELVAATSLLTYFESVPAEVERIAPDRLPDIQKSLRRNVAAQNPQQPIYQDIAGNKPVDELLERIGKAPRNLRDSLYQQLAQRVAREGDQSRAREIIATNITNARNRANALNAIEWEQISDALNKGRADKALRGVAGMDLSRDRGNYLFNLASRVGTARNLKKDEALGVLERLLDLLESSPSLEAQPRMNAMLQVANAFAMQGSTRGFEIVEPLIGRINELAAAAAKLDGFGQQFFQRDELSMQNGNAIASMATQLGQALGTLALTDFTRARRDADQFRRPEIRAAVLMQLGRQAINPVVIRQSGQHDAR